MGMKDYQQRAAGLWDEASGSVKALISELAAMNVLDAQPLTAVRIAADGVVVLRDEGGRQERVFAASGPPREAVKRAVEALGAGLGKDCALEVASGLAVTSRIILPAEDDEVLRAIIRNKVESIAPWPYAQSLHAHRAAPVPGDGSHVAVDVWVVSRALLEGVASELAAAGAGVKLASLHLPSGESLRIDFGSREENHELQRHALRAVAGLSAAAVLMACIGLILALHSASRLAADREEAARLAASLRPSASGAAVSLEEAALILHERRLQRHPAIAVVNELSGILPQTVWLDSLSLDDAQLGLKGQGSDVPALIDILERSPLFSDVNFASATQFNPVSNAEAFSIGATLEPSREEAAPP